MKTCSSCSSFFACLALLFFHDQIKKKHACFQTGRLTNIYHEPRSRLIINRPKLFCRRCLRRCVFYENIESHKRSLMSSMSPLFSWQKLFFLYSTNISVNTDAKQSTQYMLIDDAWQGCLGLKFISNIGLILSKNIIGLY